MPLPRIFDGVTEPLGLYCLATLARIGYTSAPNRVNLWSRAFNYNASWQVHTPTTPAGCPTVRVIHAGDHFIVLVNGSTSNAEITSDIANFLPTQVSPPPFEVHANGRYHECAIAIKAWLITAGVTLATPVLFVGHSKGGAIAHLLQHMYRVTDTGKTWKSVSVSFGCPRFATRHLWRRDEPDRYHVFRVLNTYDPVTDFPVAGVRISRSYIIPESIDAAFVHGGQYCFYNGGEVGPTTETGSGPHSCGDLYYRTHSYTSRRPSLADLQTNAIAWHKLESYTRVLRHYVSEAALPTLVAMDFINQSINQQEAIAPWADYLLDHGFRRDEQIIPEEPDLDYSSVGGTWDERIDSVNSAPDRSVGMFADPNFQLTVPQQQAIIGEREIRRRRRN